MQHALILALKNISLTHCTYFTSSFCDIKLTFEVRAFFGYKNRLYIFLLYGVKWELRITRKMGFYALELGFISQKNQ